LTFEGNQLFWKQVLYFFDNIEKLKQINILNGANFLNLAKKGSDLCECSHEGYGFTG